MPLHEIIKRIYQEVDDSLYIIRFLNYLINTQYTKKVSFTANNITVNPLITGLLVENKTKKSFRSIVEFYNYATGSKLNKVDINILSKIYLKYECSIMRIICNVKENDILNFFDQKYRSFLMYRDVKKNIKNLVLNENNDSLKLIWNDTNFKLICNNLICNENPLLAYKLLEEYEDKTISALYYCDNEMKYLISIN